MKKQKFKGQLHRADGHGNWTHIQLPIDAAAIFGKNGFIPVKGMPLPGYWSFPPMKSWKLHGRFFSYKDICQGLT